MQTAYEKAFSSIFDANVTTLDHRGDSVLESERTGQRLRHFAYARHSGLAFHRAHRGPQRFSWFVDTGRVKKHLDAASDFVARTSISSAKVFSPACARSRFSSPARRAFYVRGERNFGVDFRGGDLVTLSTTQHVSMSGKCATR